MRIMGNMPTIICGVVSARGYRQGNDYVPHDARVHEWRTGKTRLETLIALGRKPVLVPDPKVEDGINAAHLMFKRVWFDEARCAPGLEALRQTASITMKNCGPSRRRRRRIGLVMPDSFRYVAMAWKEIAQIPASVTPPLFKPAAECTCLEWSGEFGRPRARERA
jgi:phage terminase large subunit